MTNTRRRISLFHRTKIVATVGPSSRSRAQLRKLMQAGVNVFRLNFSHSTHEEHETVIRDLRKLNQLLNTQTCIVQDLQGPKIRIGLLENDWIRLERGASFAVTTQPIIGNHQRVGTSYKSLTRDVQVGHNILMNDGNIELKVGRVANDTVYTRVLHGGILKSRQGMNLPHTDTSTLALTPKDIKDLAFGIKHDLEWVALSFVRRAEDVLDLRRRIEDARGRMKIIAKIEKPEALHNLDEIIRVSDGIMVARGDLGVEIPMEEVPVAQKMIIRKCNAAARPVIVATHMMESMTESPRPTRAETNDVANAVSDGADAVMLSSETATGKYPIKAVRCMRRIVHSIEKNMPALYQRHFELPKDSKRLLSDRLIESAYQLSQHLSVKAIVGLTQSGYSGFRISSFRPRTPIFIFSSSAFTVRSMSIVWGAQAYYYNGSQSTDQTFIDIEQFLFKRGFVNIDDLFLILASMPISQRTVCNTLKVNKVYAEHVITDDSDALAEKSLEGAKLSSHP